MVCPRLWESPLIFDEDGSEAEHVAMDSIWALVQNNEYVFSQVFQPYDIFPGKHALGDIGIAFSDGRGIIG